MSTRVQPSSWQLPDSEVAALVAGTHGDPFSRLGIQSAGDGFIARAFIPGAEKVEAATLDGKVLGQLARRHEAGFFEGRLDTPHFA